MAVFQAMQDIFKRANVGEILLDALILMAKSSTSEQNFLQAVDYVIDSWKISKVESPSKLEPLEHINTLSSAEIDRVDLDCSESIKFSSGTHGRNKNL